MESRPPGREGMLDPPNRRVRWFSSLTLRRSLWASMLVLHVPALFASWRMFIQSGLDVGLLGGCLALSAAMLFFVLKLWGIPCLQFATDRRSLMVITVAVTLLHADAIGTRLNFVAVPENVPLTATALLATGLTRVQSVTKAALAHGRGIPKRRILTLLPSHSTWLGAFSPHRRILAALVCIPRAPPA